MEEKISSESLVVQNEQEHLSKVKVCTLIAGILQILISIPIIIGAVALTAHLISSTDPLVLLASLFMIAILYVVLGLLILSVGILWLVFGILTVRCASLENRSYARRRGILITTMVFDIIFGTLSAFFAFIMEDLGAQIILFVFSALNFLSFIFKIIDMKKFKKNVKSGKISIKETTTTKVVMANMSALSKYANGDKKKAQTLEEKLDEINALKEKGAISSEEYEEMRKKILDV